MNYKCVEIPEPDFDASFTDEMVITAYQDEDDFNPQMLDEYPNVRLSQLEFDIQQTALTAAEAFEAAEDAEQIADQAAQAAQQAAGIAEGAATAASEAAQAINEHSQATNNPHATDVTQEFADTQITTLATEATYTPTVWAYLVGLFTTVPKSVKEHIVKVWLVLYDFSLRIGRLEIVQPVAENVTFTLALTHLYKGIRCNSATAMDCNIPLNDTVAFPIGSIITIQQIGNGEVTAKGVSGVTLNGDAKTAGQYKFIQLWKTDTNVWNVIGGVA